MARRGLSARTVRRFDRLSLVLCLLVVGVTLLGLLATFSGFADAQSSVRPPENAAGNNAAGGPTGGAVPGNVSGINSDADLWRFLRGKDVPNFDATVSIPNKQAAILVQSQGEDWRVFRKGPLVTYSAIGLGITVGLLALFFLLRGRIRIEHGPSDQRIERFDSLERFAHWLLAVSFIILAITGLNITFGRYFLMDLMGPDAFATVSQAGKWAHNNVAWAFMASLVLVFVLWVGRNIPSMTDVKWLMVGGGLFTTGVHPPRRNSMQVRR